MGHCCTFIQVWPSIVFGMQSNFILVCIQRNTLLTRRKICYQKAMRPLYRVLLFDRCLRLMLVLYGNLNRAFGT
jgi:hypothetical protein